MSLQVISEFAGLSQIHQQDFRLAVLVARSKQAVTASVDGADLNVVDDYIVCITAPRYKKFGEVVLVR